MSVKILSKRDWNSLELYKTFAHENSQIENVSRMFLGFNTYFNYVIIVWKIK